MSNFSASPSSLTRRALSTGLPSEPPSFLSPPKPGTSRPRIDSAAENWDSRKAFCFWLSAVSFALDDGGDEGPGRGEEEAPEESFEGEEGRGSINSGRGSIVLLDSSKLDTCLLRSGSGQEDD